MHVLDSTQDGMSDTLPTEICYFGQIMHAAQSSEAAK
jgi:hypothetical protein